LEKQHATRWLAALTIDLARAGQDRLRSIAIATIRQSVRLPGLEVVVELSVEYPLGQRPLQPS
jgi:hypothetical protein